jgi:mannan endo-1,4-beta-mannosidase
MTGRPPGRLVAAAVALAACALALAGCRQPGFGQGLATLKPPVHATLKPDPASFLGVYEKSSPVTYAGVEQFGKTVGRQPNLAVYFSGWGEKFQGTFARAARRRGAAPFVDIDPNTVSMASIASGLHDDYLRAYAAQVRSYRHPVVISFAHEMNGGWYPWGYHNTSPRVWVLAWRHLVTVFRQAGADNVIWLWAVNRDGAGEGPIRDWWPGNDYVTWVGIDGYYESPASDFSGVFGQTIAEVRKLTSRPLIISETAVGQLSGRAVKIPGLFAGIRADHLLGLIWFDKAQHNGVHHQDWRLEGHPAAITSFRSAVQEFQ